jgi:asparagine synthase (glutamine-hydrolysing)
MCGILGIIFNEKNKSSILRSASIAHAMEVLRPRGPDESNVINFDHVVLGHTRLSIVSPDSGPQPLQGDHWIVAVNGEIYNHQHISEIQSSDCDCILNMLEKDVHPGEFLPRLQGMFAFVAYNVETDTMIIARDHVGITPLYVGDCNGSFWVSSMLRAFPKGTHPRTVQPGTFEVIDGSNLTSTVHRWNPPYNITDVPSDFSRRQYYRMLHSAVECRVTQGDVPWAVLLSGGLDSSIVAALACKVRNSNYPVVHSFCIGLKDSPDLKNAEIVAKHLGTKHHSIVYDIQDGLHYLEDVIRDLETYDVTTIRAGTPMWILGKYLKKFGIKYVLSGEGSDESWAGYLYFWKAPTAAALAEETVRKVERLHGFDCLRANKALAAHGVECRVPFLDSEVLRFTMEQVHGKHKMSKTHESGGRTEKYELRSMFQFDLPVEIVMRTKAQFSDAVGSAWIDGLKNYAEIRVTSDMMLKAPDFIKTKEAYLYWAMFKDIFFNLDSCEEAVMIEPQSIACSTKHALAWDVSYAQHADPSGDAVKLALG